MDSYEVEIKVQSVLLVVEAAACLWLAWWCLKRRHEGRWAQTGAAGATLLGLCLGVFAAAAFEQLFLDSIHVYEEVLFFRYSSLVLTVGRFAGVLLLVTAFVESRRTQPASPSIYGPT